jgi:cytochrome c5
VRANGTVRNLPTRLLVVGCVAAWLAACAFAVPLRSAPVDAAARVQTGATASGRMRAPGAPEDDLPDAPGKTLLLRSCAWCHELTEITKFRGYYTRAQWRDVVVTMTQYGARLSAEEIETLTDYLTIHLGRR